MSSPGSGPARCPDGKWRRGKESNQPRQGSLADNGFEDRGAHQVPISIQSNFETVGHSQEKVNAQERARSRFTTSTILPSASSISSSVVKIESESRRLLKARSSLKPIAF